jgi:hypothetical protein
MNSGSEDEIDDSFQNDAKRLFFWKRRVKL